MSANTIAGKEGEVEIKYGKEFEMFRSRSTKTLVMMITVKEEKCEEIIGIHIIKARAIRSFDTIEIKIAGIRITTPKTPTEMETQQIDTHTRIILVHDLTTECQAIYAAKKIITVGRDIIEADRIRLRLHLHQHIETDLITIHETTRITMVRKIEEILCTQCDEVNLLMEDRLRKKERMPCLCTTEIKVREGIIMGSQAMDIITTATIRQVTQ